jgi:pyridoxine 4-dehydrogenase
VDHEVSGASAAGHVPPPGGHVVIGGDLRVGRIGFGAMRLTGQPGNFGPYADPAAGRALLRRAVQLGVTLIETADSYGPGHSERLIADALHPYPPALVVATKVGVVKPTADPATWHPHGRPAYLREAVEACLARLRRETLDLVHLHRPDPDVPIEESIGALAGLRTDGKIRHLGVSNVDRSQLDRARAVTAIACVQNRYGVADRTFEELVEHTRAEGIAFMAHGPLGADPLRAGMALDERAQRLREVGRRHGASPGQTALAWLLARSPNIVAIPGTTSEAHLVENLAAGRIRLTAEDLRALGA